MSEKEGWIEVEVHYDALGGIERRDYKWIGGDIAVVSLSGVDVNFPREGDKLEIGPFKVRVLERNLEASWKWDVITVVRDRGLVTDLRCLWHRFGKTADIAYRRFIITLVVWRLAERNEGVIPTWRNIYVLRWINRIWESWQDDSKIGDAERGSVG